MYTILVEQDNSLYGLHKERIMQRSKCVDTLVFIVDPIYKNTHDMTNATVFLEYLLPVSKKYLTEILTLSDERYNDCYLQYKLPFDTNLTAESGIVELQLTFIYTELDENGNGIQRVRKTSPTTINIVPIAAWADIVPDAALSSIDQRLIVMNAQMQALNDYMNVLDDSQVDNLIYNEDESTLQLSANGVGIGDKVVIKSGEDSLEDGVPVVDFANTLGGSSSNETEDEGNVVEF